MNYVYYTNLLKWAIQCVQTQNGTKIMRSTSLLDISFDLRICKLLPILDEKWEYLVKQACVYDNNLDSNESLMGLYISIRVPISLFKLWWAPAHLGFNQLTCVYNVDVWP